MPSHKIELAPDISSCTMARRFVDETMAEAAEELRADASLLISEVVTNALLHAHGPVTVEVQQKGGAYRIVVGDRSRTPPTEKGYRVDDATGRGLQLLDLLAAAWGWDRTATGKIVWFDLPEPFDGAPSRRAQHELYEDPYPDGTPIALLDAPVQEMIRTNAHYDAIYREFRLISELDPSHLQAVPGHLLSLIDHLGTSLMGFGRSVEETWEKALRENQDRVDLHFRFPAAAGPGVAWYSQLLDQADEYCQRAELLTVAPTDESRAVRRWVFGQVAGQCQGEPPIPWSRVSPTNA
ncbi:MAG TPA: ATP-binding protein [Acidimicrobiales bacterium]|jgi:anti-sigma regulatory factor (Ser/Thr protein kinase)|nr:ATP-binding protein [Acidimicrobiales bacterium]